MPGRQTNMPESQQNNASSINQYWKATFMLLNMAIARPVDWKQALYFSSPLVSQFVLVLCFVQNAPFTLLGSKGACSAGYFWIELAIYRYLAWKPTLQLQNIILEFDFSRKREKSVANTWEHEIGCEIVRLTTKSWVLACRSVLNI